MKNITDDRIHIPAQFNTNKVLLMILFFTITTRIAGIASPLTSCPLAGDLECDSECEEIDEDSEDETYISNLDPGIFSSCVRVFGTLYIDENTDLYEAQFVMEPGAEIVVMGGYRLTISSSLLIAGCDQLWKGIRVEDGAIFHTYYSKISGANAAIYLGNRCYLRAWYSTFENNYIGIATAMPYDESSVPKAMNGGLIIGCDFINIDVLRTPYDGHYYDPDWPSDAHIPYNRDFAAIYLRNTSGLNVGIYNPVASTRNTIDGLRNGIVVDEMSTVDVGYCDISNLVGTKTSSILVEDLTSTGVYSRNSVVNIHDNDLSQLQDGIVSFSSRANIEDNEITLKILSPPPSLRTETRGIYVSTANEPNYVLNNTILEGDVGIYLDGGYTSEIHVNENIITSITDGAGRIGIQANQLKSRQEGFGEIKQNEITFTDIYFGVGIWLNIAGRLAVEENDISFVRENQNNAKSSVGIRTRFLEDSGINRHFTFSGEDDYATTNHYAIFYENSPRNTVFCNQPDQFSRALTGSGMCNFSQFVANVFDISNPLALELRAPTRIDPQEHNGNTWGEDDHDVFGAYISGSDPLPTAQASRFIVDNDNICTLWPCPIGPSSVASIWFDDQTGTPKTCASNPDPIDLSDDDYVDMLLHPGDFEDFGDQMTWMTKAMIFEAILLNQDLLENDRLDSFYNAEDADPLGILVAADFAMHEPGIEIEDLFDLNEEIMDSLAVVVWIDEELYDLSPDSNDLRSRREDAVDTIQLLQEDRFELLSDVISARTSAFSDAETALSSVSTDTDFEEYYRRALMYEIEWTTDGPSSLSAGDWEEIQEIATLCTWEGGKASALAQALCMTARDSIVEPITVCTGVEPRGQSLQEDMNIEFMVFPNPTGTGWHMILPELATHVQVLDVSGRIKMTLEVESAELFVPALDLPSGIYIIQIKNSRRELSSKKVILQR